MNDNDGTIEDLIIDDDDFKEEVDPMQADDEEYKDQEEEAEGALYDKELFAAEFEDDEDVDFD
jgi:hypothetical protein